MPYKTKEELYAKQAAHRARNFDKMVEHLRANPCVDCGETDIVVLQFDHLPGSDKKFDVARAVYGSTRSWAAIEQEIAKCEVVCSNDHDRRTSKRAGSQKYRLMLESSHDT